MVEEAKRDGPIVAVDLETTVLSYERGRELILSESVEVLIMLQKWNYRISLYSRMETGDYMRILRSLKDLGFEPDFHKNFIGSSASSPAVPFHNYIITDRIIGGFIGWDIVEALLCPEAEKGNHNTNPEDNNQAT